MKERVIKSVYYGVREPKSSDLYGKCVQQLQQMLCEGYPRYVIELVLEHDNPVYGKPVLNQYQNAIDRFYN